jgi:hypothetical protein
MRRHEEEEEEEEEEEGRRKQDAIACCTIPILAKKLPADCSKRRDSLDVQRKANKVKAEPADMPCNDRLSSYARQGRRLSPK